MSRNSSLRSIVIAGLSVSPTIANQSWRSVGGAVFSVVTVLVVGALSPCRADVNPQGDCWIDAATGAFVATYPQGADPREFINSAPQNQYGNPHTGRNFAKLPDGSWIDSGTGQPVSTFPVGGNPRDFINSAPQNQYGNSHTGRNFARVPCPPPSNTTGAQALPVLPFVGFGLGFGHRDHGDDRFQK